MSAHRAQVPHPRGKALTGGGDVVKDPFFSRWVIGGALALQLSGGKGCSWGDRVCRREKCSPASWPSRQFQKPPRLLLFTGGVETVGTLPLNADGGKVASVGGGYM